MKQFFISLVLMLYTVITVQAQVPDIFNYQGVARNAAGVAYANKDILVKVNIRNVNSGGPVIFSETRAVTTNSFGLFNLPIGGFGGTNVTGAISTIDWHDNKKYLETEISIDGEPFTSLGISQILSAPYAFSSSIAKSLVLPFSKTVNSNNPWGLLNIQNDNTHITTIAINGVSVGGKGISGRSETGYGVQGTAADGVGVHATASTATGKAIYARNFTGEMALEIDGKLKIAGGNTNPGTGKILTSDGQGNATWQENTKIAFRASGLNGNVTQSILPYTATKINFFEDARYNIGSAYNASTSTFVVPVTGIYHLNAQVAWLNNELGGQMRLKLLRAGNYSDLAFTSLIKTGGSALEHSLAVDIRLQQGDQVWVEVFQDLGTPRHIMTDGFRTWFAGHLIVRD